LIRSHPHSVANAVGDTSSIRFRRTLASAYAVPASGVASGVVKALGKLSGREIRSLRRAVLGLFGGDKALDNRLGSTDFCA
jgi:hypothetical protein